MLAAATASQFPMSIKHIKSVHLPSSKEIFSILYVKLADEPVFIATKKNIIESNMIITHQKKNLTIDY